MGAGPPAPRLPEETPGKGGPGRSAGTGEEAAGHAGSEGREEEEGAPDRAERVGQEAPTGAEGQGSGGRRRGTAPRTGEESERVHSGRLTPSGTLQMEGETALGEQPGFLGLRPGSGGPGSDPGSVVAQRLQFENSLKEKSRQKLHHVFPKINLRI